MVEVVKPNEKVRDLTEAPRQIPIRIEGSVSYEVLVALWTTYNPYDGNRSGYLGAEWHQQVKDMTAEAGLEDDVDRLGGPWASMWLAVAGLIETAPHPHEPERVFGWVRDMAPTRFRRWVLWYLSHSSSASLIEQAATGDADALRELFCDRSEEECEKSEAVIEFFENTDDELPRQLGETILRFYEEVFVKLDLDFGAAVGRAASARRSVANRDDAKAVIEEVTQGLDYDIPLGVTRVVLIPSVIIKPLSVIDQHRDALIVYYGMADEFIDSDPEAPPSWLVNTYKALSDERRLRILRRLSEGDASLDELTEVLGLSKSTVHHHMSILRGAGLVRVHVPAGKGHSRSYGLRDTALGDASGFLNSYLRAPELEVEHA